MAAKVHLVDIHCHIDMYSDPASVAEEAETNWIYTVAVTNLPSAFSKVESLLSGMRHVRPALGLHPQNAYRYHYEMEQMWRLLDRTSYIGEIGLDYSTPDSANRQIQRYVFGQILNRCSSAGNKILSIHSRCASADVISAIGPGFPGKVILHWFAGSKRELEQAISYGYHFSINPAMARSKRGASLVAAVPPDRLLTESDGPYVKVNRRQARPHDVDSVICAIAGLLKVDGEEMTKIICKNFRALIISEKTKEKVLYSKSLDKNSR